MTFKLSTQLNQTDDPQLPFRRYRSYIEENRSRIPASALKIIDHQDWSGGSSSQAPYYSHLIGLESTGLGQPAASLKLLLQKDMYVEKPFRIAITYQNVLGFELAVSNAGSEMNLMWRYEQFLCFDATPTHETERTYFTHQIEWVGGTIWSITAGEIEVEWFCP